MVCAKGLLEPVINLVILLLKAIINNCVYCKLQLSVQDLIMYVVIPLKIDSEERYVQSKYGQATQGRMC